MNFGFDNGPHIKDSDNVSKMMNRIIFSLLPIIIFSIYNYGYLPYLNNNDILVLIKPLLMILLSISISFITEYIYIRFIMKKDKDTIKNLNNSYPLITGLLFVLIIPYNTPYYLIILGSFIATFIGKMIFGGFGYYIFNPALIGLLFIMTLSNYIGNLNTLDFNITSLSISNYLEIDNLNDYFIGLINGSLGEISKILIILSFVYLTITKTIKSLIPLSYIIVVFIMTYIISLFNNVDIYYPIYNIISGSLLFMAVFIATDPLTSPVSKSGQLIYGISLGILTILFRYLNPNIDSVITSILTMNMLVIIIDNISAKGVFKKNYKIIPYLILITLIILISIYIGIKGVL